uniref:SMP-30/Gluconolactonase/LRE-like region domain-containing protein n=1 Tax=Aplanochytrium stocchinoi TaxID=215587 RepID=A0A7S3PFK1_9STRA
MQEYLPVVVELQSGHSSHDYVSLGEGAVWCPITEKLLWIDVKRGRIHIYDAETKTNRTIEVEQPIGTVVPFKKTQVLAALLKGFCIIDILTGEIVGKLGTNPEADNIRTRFNDGKCCPYGNFWIGSMGLFGEPDCGALYCVDKHHVVHKRLETVSISNGICWSLDAKTMYYIDTPRMAVDAFDYDGTTATIVNRRICIKIPKEMGMPDGCCLDSHGKVGF